MASITFVHIRLRASWVDIYGNRSPVDLPSLSVIRHCANAIRRTSVTTDGAERLPKGESAEFVRRVELTRLCRYVGFDSQRAVAVAFSDRGIVCLPRGDELGAFAKTKRDIIYNMVGAGFLHAGVELHWEASVVAGVVPQEEVVNMEELEETTACAEDLGVRDENGDVKPVRVVRWRHGQEILCTTDPTSTLHDARLQRHGDQEPDESWRLRFSRSIEERTWCRRCEAYQKLLLRVEPIPKTLSLRRVPHCASCGAYVSLNKRHMRSTAACSSKSCNTLGEDTPGSVLFDMHVQGNPVLPGRCRFVRQWKNDSTLHAYGYDSEDTVTVGDGAQYHRLPHSVWHRDDAYLMGLESVHTPGYDVHDANAFLRKHIHLFASLDNVLAVSTAPMRIDDNGDIKVITRMADNKPEPWFCLAVYVVDRRWRGCIADLHGRELCDDVCIDVRQAFVSPCMKHRASHESLIACNGVAVSTDGNLNQYGTIGAIVRDKEQGRIWGLTCEHVLHGPRRDSQNTNHTATVCGGETVEYSTVRQGRNEFAVVAENENVRVHSTPRRIEGHVVEQSFDTALVALGDAPFAGKFVQGDWYGTDLQDKELLLAAPVEATPDAVLYKVGASTGLTKGIVGANVLVTDRLPVMPGHYPLKLFFSDHVHIKSAEDGGSTPFALGGDSGSVACAAVPESATTVRMQPSLLVVSTFGPYDAIGKSIPDILTALDVEVVLDEAPTDDMSE